MQFFVYLLRYYDEKTIIVFRAKNKAGIKIVLTPHSFRHNLVSHIEKLELLNPTERNYWDIPRNQQLWVYPLFFKTYPVFHR